MTFNDQIRSLSNQEIADIFQFAGIEAKKFYKDRIACTCPIGGSKCYETQRCTFYFNTVRVECLHAGHGGDSLYNIIKK